MFAGPEGKKLMIEQGYVPAACLMDEDIAGPLIYFEIQQGENPCWGCNVGGDRSVCKGQPRKEGHG